MEKGTVKWFDSRKGYGFIAAENGQDVFVHQSQIQAESGTFRKLNEGDEVEFNTTAGQKGPQASEVKVTKKSTLPQSRPRQQRPRQQFNSNRRQRF
jgi:CspA family cold shock protein